MEAKNIVAIESNSTTGRSQFILNENGLRRILIGHKDRKIVVISVAGAFRQGKSFLLNVFLRYLMTLKSNGKPPAKGWLKRGGTLKGFEYRGGVEGCTQGIWAWPELFVFPLDDGSEVAVMLVDCQGTFDTRANSEECAMIFAFSTLLSSIQIYNVNKQIQRDHLETMQLFVEYGKLAADNQRENNSLFQTLVFTVRDFSNAKEFAYGLEGGKAYLENKLNLGDGQSSQLKNIKGFVWNTFDRVECCLSPYPGESVDQGDADYMTSINDKFVDVLEDLAATLLHPANLVPKQVAGQDITCSEFLNLLKSYAKPLENGNCIGPNTILQANAKLRNIKLRNELLKKYSDSARQALENNLWLNANEMHYKLKGNVLHDFDKAKKLGGDAMAAKHREELENDIESTFTQLREFLNKMRDFLMAEEKAIGFRTYGDSMNRFITNSEAKIPIGNAQLFQIHEQYCEVAVKPFQKRIQQYNSGKLDYDCRPVIEELQSEIMTSYNDFVIRNKARTEIIKTEAKAKESENLRIEAERVAEQFRKEKGYADAKLEEERELRKQEDQQRKEDLKTQTEMFERMTEQHNEQLERVIARNNEKTEEMQAEFREMMEEAERRYSRDMEAAERRHQSQMQAISDSAQSSPFLKLLEVAAAVIAKRFL